MSKKTLCDIQGVYASGAACGIKPEKKDLAFIYVPQAFASAGVFTRNKFPAACVEYTREIMKHGTIKAVVANSGNANAATGEQGLANARQTAQAAAALLHLRPEEVATASTGIIGVQLPMDKIIPGVKALLAEPTKCEGALAAEAIMTTDTFPKEIYLEQATAGGAVLTVAGIAKGSGMIAPNMGTMLAFLATNARISSEKLQQFLAAAVDDSFNMVSVDTDTSTNDVALIFATGAVDVQAEEEKLFARMLHDACVQLAVMIARDGEGAERLIEVEVLGALNKEEARKIAMNIINSPLVKCAIHGADPNWGRIVAAAGKDPALAVEPRLIDLFLGPEQILSKGAILDYKKEQAREHLSGKEVYIRVDLHLGEARATAWGCDLTKGYIDINTAYS